MSEPRYQVDVSVVTRYLPEQSQPEQQRYAFAYTITVQNKGSVRAQLLSRHWIITDGDGHVEEVRGEGVVGQQPEILPGDQYTYSSGSVIPTMVGTMQGSFLMNAADGNGGDHSFKANIAPFRLAVPGALH